jgi:hypothetical protein
VSQKKSIQKKKFPCKEKKMVNFWFKENDIPPSNKSA